jgi:hypothetical protein
MHFICYTDDANTAIDPLLLMLCERRTSYERVHGH